jgi:hypothetical protein
MARYSETRRTFSQGYRCYQQLHIGGGHRLDYVLASVGGGIPAGIRQHFAHARTLHVNQRYQLIALW